MPFFLYLFFLFYDWKKGLSRKLRGKKSFGVLSTDGFFFFLTFLVISLL